MLPVLPYGKFAHHKKPGPTAKKYKTAPRASPSSKPCTLHTWPSIHWFWEQSSPMQQSMWPKLYISNMSQHDIDTQGEVIERFTDKYNLCILNDGSHTYLKAQAQYVNKQTSVIDLTISTPGLGLRNAWEVLPDTHGSDHYPILTSILPSVAET